MTQRTSVPPGATELSLLARSASGDVLPVATISLSREFRDRFELGDVLGSGAMGMVCRARDRSMNREVAIKFLILDEPEFTRRFVAEGRMLARVRHPNVVPVYDLEDLEDHPYIVTECLEGGTLRERIPLAPAAAVEVMAALLDGLAACHASGIVHRDLKPENILFAADGTPKISDLGIARDAANQSVTQTGALIGTPRYMAPEQALGDIATFASDVHAMGAMLFEMIAGRLPFVSRNRSELLRDIIVTPAPPLDTSTTAKLPPGLALLVARALAKDPAERPGVEELATALRRTVAPRPVSRRSRAPRAAPARKPELAVAATLVLGLGVLFATGAPRPPPPPPPSVTTSPRPSPRAGLPSEAAAQARARALQKLHMDAESAVLQNQPERLAIIGHDPRPALVDRLRPQYQQLTEGADALQASLDREGARAEAAPLRTRALMCEADGLVWQAHVELDGFQRYRGGRRFYNAMLGVCSVEDCVRAQRILRDVRSALARPLSALAAEPESVQRLLMVLKRMGRHVRRIRKCIAYDMEEALLIPSLRAAQNSEVLLPALERVTGQALGTLSRADGPPPLVERAIQTLWSTDLSTPESKEAVVRLEAALGPGTLARLLQGLEL